MTYGLLSLIAAGFIAGAVLTAFLMMLIGIKSEERRMTLRSGTPTRTGHATRLFLGVYVRREGR